MKGLLQHWNTGNSCKQWRLQKPKKFFSDCPASCTLLSYMSIFIHNYQKTSFIWVQKVEMNWLVLPQNTSSKNYYFCRQSYYRICVCIYISIYIYIYIYICMYMYMCICVCICEYIYWWNNDGWLYNERQYLGVARSVLRVSVFKWKIWKTETLETTCFTPKWGLHLCFQPLLFIHVKIITCTLFFSYMYIQIYRYVCISLCIHICI